MDYYILMSSEGIPFKTNIENNAQVVKIAGLLFDFILYSKELWMEPSAAYHFSLDGAPFSVEPCGGDPAGDACLVVTTSGRRYLLQRISGPSGEDGPAEPIRAVPPAGGALKPVPAADGGYCYRDGTGTYRVFHFEEGKA